MIKNWEKVKIKDIAEILTDYVSNGSFASLAKNVNYQKEGYARLIRLVDYNNGFDESDSVWVDKHGYEFLAKSKLNGGEIIISNVGEYAGTAFLAPFKDYPITLAPNSIMLKTKDIDDFYYYYFKSPIGYKQLRTIVSSSGQPKFNKTNFKELIIPRPKIEEQKKIVKLLKPIDSKIEKNNQINAELESLAKTIYDYWFLQFEFPNEEGKPYKSSGGKMVWNDELKREIPEGWEVKKIQDFCKIFTGKKDVNQALPKGKYKFYSCAPEYKYSNDLLYSGKAILISGNGSYTGRTIFVDDDIDLYQRTYAVVNNSQDDVIEYIYYSLLKFMAPRVSGGTHGSAIPYIVYDDIANEKIVYNKETINLFISYIRPILQKTNNLKKQNQELASLRDFLLPMLMNGQVTFKDENY